MHSHSIILAGLAGFFCALVFSSVPVGPINLTILNEGCRRGFAWALLIGLGAAVMEVIYCSIAFAGFSSFLDYSAVKATMQVCSFVFLLFLGAKFMMAQSVNVPTSLDSASAKLEASLDKKLHPHSAFMTGFVRVMGNLGVLLTWVVMAAYLMSHEASFTARSWVADRLAAKIACVTRRPARNQPMVSDTELQRVAGPRKIQPTIPAANAALFRLLPAHGRGSTAAPTSSGN